jgi:HEAT repeat protein
MKTGFWPAALLGLLVASGVFGQAASQSADLEDWRQILRYGIETEVLSTIKQIAESGEQALNGELLELVRPESSPELLQAVLELFGSQELPGAETRVREMLASEAQDDPRRLGPMIRYLAAVRSEAAEQVLLPFLDSVNEQLALAAIGALGNLGGQASGQRLLELLRDPQYREGLKPQLILSIGKLKFAPALDDLLGIVGNPDGNKVWRMYSATALGDIGDNRAVPALRSLLADPDSLVRAYAASALAKFEMSEVEGALQEGLRDSNVKVRIAAAKALANPAASRSVEILIFKARKDPERQVRAQAIESLGEIGGARAFAFLRELYQDDTAANQYREAALSALCARDLPDSLPAIATVIDRVWSRKDQMVLSFTARRLATVSSGGLDGIFERFLGHPNVVIRLYGIRGVRLNKFQRLRAKVSTMAAEDPHPAVRREAAIALQEL